MELRVLRYFLAVARSESISGAAEVLHVTQPTLSRQLMDLEKEVGQNAVSARKAADHTHRGRRFAAETSRRDIGPGG